MGASKKWQCDLADILPTLPTRGELRVRQLVLLGRACQSPDRRLFLLHATAGKGLPSPPNKEHPFTNPIEAPANPVHDLSLCRR